MDMSEGRRMRSKEQPRFQKKIRSKESEIERLSAQVKSLEELLHIRTKAGAPKTEIDGMNARLRDRKSDLRSWGIV
jgi:peptidoglycan hydrolase CwlO-like protein